MDAGGEPFPWLMGAVALADLAGHAGNGLAAAVEDLVRVKVNKLKH